MIFTRLLLISIICFLFHPKTEAQPLSVYSDIQRQVMVWDDGMLRKIDYLPPVQLKTGRVAIPYIDNARNFKIYYRGGVRKINLGFTNAFMATDCIVAYQNATAAYVFDRGEIYRMGLNVTGLRTGDSVAMCFDEINRQYMVYYEGEVKTLEDYMASDAVTKSKVTDNIIAYQNYANQFRIFYHGIVTQLDDFPVEKFDAGRDLVAWVDINRQFKVFYQGKVEQLENFPPRNFIAGDHLVAYVTNEVYFKIYFEGDVYEIGFFEPNFQVGDNIVAYRDAGGYLRVFYKGAVHTLEAAYPEKLEIKYHSMAYRNQANILRMFSFGELYDVTTAEVDAFVLDYDVVQYRFGTNIFKFFYKGREY